MSRERPILFSGPMVRAILDGRKTQTRRVVNPQPTWIANSGRWEWPIPKSRVNAGCCTSVVTASREWWEYLTPSQYPYGQPGDTLWVRETWRTLSASGGGGEPREVQYRAGGIEDRPSRDPVGRDIIPSQRGPGEVLDPLGRAWRPSIFMPRWASRLTLRIKSVRVERLHDISEDDARAEGMTPCGRCSGSGIDPVRVGGVDPDWCSECGGGSQCITFRDAFAQGWDTINGKRAAWASNPWAWLVSFEVKS